MKNIVNRIKQKDSIICFIIYFIVFLAIAQIYPSTISCDYLWNFQSTYKMYNGYEIYKDINVIVTPFFFYIGLIFFKVFGANFLVFNIYGAVINALIITLIYITIKNLKCSKRISLLVALGLYTILQMSMACNGANYNFLALLLVLIGINLEIKENDRKSKWTNYLQGLITFLVLFTKQNIGVYYLIATTIYKFLKNKSLKEKLIDCIKQYSIIFIFGMMFLAYLKISNTWDGFFYYVISGIQDFTLNFAVSNIGNSDMFFLIIPFAITFLGIIGIKKGVFDEIEKNNVKLLMCISIASLGYIIPIANNAHILKTATIGVIAIVYVIKLILKKEIKINKRIFKILLILMIGIIILEVGRVILVCSKVKMIYIKDIKNPFFYTAMEDVTYNQIETITSYIKEKEDKGINVIVIDASSPLYMIPLNKSNGKFDCFNNGNLGRDGGQGAIEEIKQMKNTEILIVTNDEDVFWQEPEEVRTYIKENLEYAGEIEQFSIYKTK